MALKIGTVNPEASRTIVQTADGTYEYRGHRIVIARPAGKKSRWVGTVHTPSGETWTTYGHGQRNSFAKQIATAIDLSEWQPNPLDKSRITRSDYPAVFGDTDRDEIPDVDDPHPTRPGDKKSIEEVRLADEMQALLDTRAEFVPVLDEMKHRLGALEVRGATIKGRVKTPYSIINKLRRKRLSTLTDVAGVMMIVPDAKALDDAAAAIESQSESFEIIERDDYYARPKDGYRALHYIVRIQGSPVELQLKTQRMAQIAKASHTAYKRGALDAAAMDELGDLAAQADRGDRMAQVRVDALLADKAALARLLTRRGNPQTVRTTIHQRELARRLAAV